MDNKILRQDILPSINAKCHSLFVPNTLKINGKPLTSDIDIDVPSKTSELENDSNFVTETRLETLQPGFPKFYTIPGVQVISAGQWATSSVNIPKGEYLAIFTSAAVTNASTLDDNTIMLLVRDGNAGTLYRNDSFYFPPAPDGIGGIRRIDFTSVFRMKKTTTAMVEFSLKKDLDRGYYTNNVSNGLYLIRLS